MVAVEIVTHPSDFLVPLWGKVTTFLHSVTLEEFFFLIFEAGSLYVALVVLEFTM